MKVRDWNPEDGDALQGDVVIFRIPDHIVLKLDDEIAPESADGPKLLVEEPEFASHVRGLLNYEQLTGKFTWPEAKTPHEAIAWSYGRPVDKYHEAVRT